MKFFCINNQGANSDIEALLQKACASRGLEFVSIDPTLFLESDLEEGALLYRISTDRRSYLVERYLIHHGVTTFYRTRERRVVGSNDMVANTMRHEAAGIAIPKTVYFVPRGGAGLQQAVQSVGGFPVIVKVEGGSHGCGVIKVDSIESLTSLMDFLYEQNFIAILRQFIPAASSARLIVLGDGVIDSIEYVTPAGDFRSNAGHTPTVRPQEFPAAVQELAVQSLRPIDLEFGGVDIMSGPDGKHVVTEVNFPCNFARAQMITGVDIAGMMVDYLQQKAAA